MELIFDDLKSKQFNVFSTPVPPKKSRNVLQISTDGKVRSKSDSNTPFAKRYYNNSTKKTIVWNDENISVNKRDQINNNNDLLLLRSPLQPLKCNSGIANDNLQKKTSSIEKSGKKLLFSTPRLQRGTKSQASNFHSASCGRLYSSLTHKSRNASSNEYSNIFNVSKQFVIFDETPVRYQKQYFLQNEDLHTSAHNLDVRNNSTGVHTQKKILTANGRALSTFENDTGSSDRSSKSQENSVRKTVHNKNTINYSQHIYEFENLPGTETIGNNFWGENDIEVEEVISLEDIIASANIWDTTENNHSHYYSPNWSFDSSYEPKLMPEPNPLLVLNLKPETIEFPWDENIY